MVGFNKKLGHYAITTHLKKKFSAHKNYQPEIEVTGVGDGGIDLLQLSEELCILVIGTRLPDHCCPALINSAGCLNMSYLQKKHSLILVCNNGSTEYGHPMKITVMICSQELLSFKYLILKYE